jgi:hypothetical protein
MNIEPIVMAGLDPAIRGRDRSDSRRGSMDHRVKPGDDD